MKALILISLIGVIDALGCNQEFNYYDNYGYGFDVKCQEITDQYFHQLSNITIYNEISLTIENSSLINVTSEIFRNIQNLRCLYLANSTFNYSSDHEIFHLLQNLEHLVITNTPFLVNRHTFVGLENAAELVLSNNSLDRIEPDSFKSLIRLRNLRINYNKIRHVNDLPLCEMRNLRMLNLSLNIIDDLKNQIFYCKKSNPQMNLNLNNQDFKINIASNDFSSISDYALELTELDLSYNKIRDLGIALTDLKSLRLLKIEGNLLTLLDNSNLYSLDQLEGLYVRNNVLEKIGDKIFSNKQNLEILDFSHNKLNNFTISEAPILKHLDISYNKISSIEFLKGATLKNLRTLILSHNNITDINPNTFQKFSELQILNLQYNHLKLENFSFNGLEELRELFLGHNSLEELPIHVFKDMKRLHRLDLSQNKLKNLDHADIFQSLKELQVLNISYNLLEDFNYNILEPLDDLRVLDIAGNRLKFIQYDLILSNLRFLSILNIKSNFLSCELLYELVQFLKKKNVSYSTSEKFNYDKENVAGIYCVSEKAVMRTAMPASPLARNDVLFDLSVAVVIIVSIVILGLGLFKFHIYLKRRRYRADEFELIHG